MTTLTRMTVATEVTQVMGSTGASRRATRVTGDIWSMVDKKARDRKVGLGGQLFWF